MPLLPPDDSFAFAEIVSKARITGQLEHEKGNGEVRLQLHNVQGTSAFRQDTVAVESLYQ